MVPNQDSSRERQIRGMAPRRGRRDTPPELNPKGGTLNVLIADDNPNFRSTLKEMLESRPNIEEVWEAKDGEEAVRLARKLLPDLVLMDLAMPRIDGLEATRLIKDQQPAVRVILLSAHEGEILHRAAVANGADGYLDKSQCASGLEEVGRLRGKQPVWIDQDAGDLEERST